MVNQAVVMSFVLSSGTKFLAKFSSGFLLKEILDRCTSKIQDELMPNGKMWMYSSHDSALFSFLNSLGISDVTKQPSTECECLINNSIISEQARSLRCNDNRRAETLQK